MSSRAVSRIFFWGGGVVLHKDFFSGKEVSQKNRQKRRENSFISIFFTFLRVKIFEGERLKPLTLPLDTALISRLRDCF